MKTELDGIVAIDIERVGFDIIRAQDSHTLRKVPIFTSALCRVIKGQKHLYLSGNTVTADSRSVILMPAGAELMITNHASRDGYLAEIISFPHPVIESFCLKFGEIINNGSQSTHHNLCITMDSCFISAWEIFRQSVDGDMPYALQEHYAHGVLLALTMMGHVLPLLINRQDLLSSRIQRIFLLDPAYDWTTSNMAARLHIGASTLRRKLTQEGRGFREILEDVRLGVGLHQLQSTQKSIELVAEVCGYSSSKFSKRFKLRYGVTPRELRIAINPLLS